MIEGDYTLFDWLERQKNCPNFEVRGEIFKLIYDYDEPEKSFIIDSKGQTFGLNELINFEES